MPHPLHDARVIIARMAAVALAVNVVTSLALNLTLYSTLEHSRGYDGSALATLFGGL